MARKRNLCVPALQCDANFDGTERRWIDLQFGAGQAAVHHHRDAVGNSLSELRRVHAGSDSEDSGSGRENDYDRSPGGRENGSGGDANRFEHTNGEA